MRRFFQRGGVWVLVQNTLLAAVIVLAVWFRGSTFHPVAVIAGVSLLLIAAGVSLAGALALGRNLTPFPKPGGQAQLVRHGIYSVSGRRPSVFIVSQIPQFTLPIFTGLPTR